MFPLTPSGEGLTEVNQEMVSPLEHWENFKRDDSLATASKSSAMAQLLSALSHMLAVLV